jgi:hypothetical protein
MYNCIYIRDANELNFANWMHDSFNFRWLHIPLETVNISTWIQHTYEQNKQVNPTAGTQSEGNEPCHDEAALFFSRWISRWEANGYRITHLIYTHFSLQSFTLSLSPSTFISLSLSCLLCAGRLVSSVNNAVQPTTQLAQKATRHNDEDTYIIKKRYDLVDLLPCRYSWQFPYLSRPMIK